MIRLEITLSPFQIALMLHALEIQGEQGEWVNTRKQLEVDVLERQLKDIITKHRINTEKVLDYQLDFEEH